MPASAIVRRSQGPATISGSEAARRRDRTGRRCLTGLVQSQAQRLRRRGDEERSAQLHAQGEPAQKSKDKSVPTPSPRLQFVFMEVGKTRTTAISAARGRSVEKVGRVRSNVKAPRATPR